MIPFITLITIYLMAIFQADRTEWTVPVGGQNVS